MAQLGDTKRDDAILKKLTRTGNQYDIILKHCDFGNKYSLKAYNYGKKHPGYDIYIKKAGKHLTAIIDMTQNPVKTVRYTEAVIFSLRLLASAFEGRFRPVDTDGCVMFENNKKWQLFMYNFMAATASILYKRNYKEFLRMEHFVRTRPKSHFFSQFELLSDSLLARHPVYTFLARNYLRIRGYPTFRQCLKTAIKVFGWFSKADMLDWPLVNLTEKVK